MGEVKGVDSLNSLTTDIRFVKGIGEKRAKLFNELSINTLGDFLTYFPRDYEDRTRFMQISELKYGESACIKVILATEIITSRTRGGQTITKFRVFDETGSLSITFFNQTYIKNQLQKGKEYIFFGKVQGDLLGAELMNPAFEAAGGTGKTTGRILPVYPMILGLSRNIIMQGVETALAAFGMTSRTYCRQEFGRSIHLHTRDTLLKTSIFQKRWRDALLSRKRFVFEELFFLSVGLKRMKNGRQKEKGIPFETLEMEDFISSFGFSLTGAPESSNS